MMGDNFYSYLYDQAAAPAFDELAEIVDLSNVDSINRAFVAYVKDNPPPFELQESLLEETFRSSEDKEQGEDDNSVRYNLHIPGVEDDFSAEELKTYLEDFLDEIGAETDANNSAIVDVETVQDDRGGVDVRVYVAVSGAQIKPLKKKQD